MSQTRRRADRNADAPTAGRRAHRLWRRWWPQASVLCGALLWWPVGFWGLQPWLHLPLRALQGDLVLLGATAAAASVSLLVRSPWPRFGIVLVFSGIGWLVSAPVRDAYPDERQVLVVILAVAAFVGIILGARGSAGPVGAAAVLAVVAGLSPATWPHGALVAVALALPFAVASWQRVAPTMLTVTRIAITWLLAALVAAAGTHAWGVLRPQLPAGTVGADARLVASAAWDYVRAQWWHDSAALVGRTSAWLWVAVALAVVIAAARALTRRLRRQAAPTPG